MKSLSYLEGTTVEVPLFLENTDTLKYSRTNITNSRIKTPMIIFSVFLFICKIKWCRKSSCLSYKYFTLAKTPTLNNYWIISRKAAAAQDSLR